MVEDEELKSSLLKSKHLVREHGKLKNSTGQGSGEGSYRALGQIELSRGSSHVEWKSRFSGPSTLTVDICLQ